MIIPLKDLPYTFEKELKSDYSVYNFYNQEKDRVKLFHYFITVWYVGLVEEINQQENNEPRDFNIDDHYQYLVRQTNKLYDKYNNEEGLQNTISTYIKINLCLLGIYENRWDNKIEIRGDKKLPPNIIKEYKNYDDIRGYNPVDPSNIFVTQDVIEETGREKQVLNIFDQKTRAKFLDDIEKKTLINGVRKRYGKILYPLLHEPLYEKKLDQSVTEYLQGKNQKRINEQANSDLWNYLKGNSGLDPFIEHENYIDYLNSLDKTLIETMIRIEKKNFDNVRIETIKDQLNGLQKQVRDKWKKNNYSNQDINKYRLDKIKESRYKLNQYESKRNNQDQEPEGDNKRGRPKGSVDQKVQSRNKHIVKLHEKLEKDGYTGSDLWDKLQSKIKIKYKETLSVDYIKNIYYDNR